MPEAFHQVSAQEDLFVGRRCWFENSKMSILLHCHLMSEWDDICCFWVSMLPESGIKFLLKIIYGLEDGG